MGSISPLQIVLIVAVVVLLFGAPKLPILARSVGKSMRILKEETRKMSDDEPVEDDAVARKDSDA